jgi:adenosine deaminase
MPSPSQPVRQVTMNFLAVQQALDLDRHAIHTLARHAFQAAFSASEKKQTFLAELERYVQTHTT